ncbi:hypothetical protein RchiOBHm_Chr1g0314591 [Rosa chinensis]|uniref:Uncharacterized protein n=1 Tax=Rosa chinensis TaxID=74649 RepID=A0A2P6S753_ROSCH|nr:hypothetical protein RchiOBHm_Chr1g0314591 [Rosa chinensis]
MILRFVSLDVRCWFHRAASTSRSLQWKDNRLVPPESTMTC